MEQRDLVIGEIRLREVTNLALARLRLGNASTVASPQTAQLPARTGQCAGSDPAFLCLGPGEWLVISAKSSAPDLVHTAQSSSGAGFAAAYDLTPGLVVLRLTGDAAPWLH